MRCFGLRLKPLGTLLCEHALARESLLLEGMIERLPPSADCGLRLNLKEGCVVGFAPHLDQLLALRLIASHRTGMLLLRAGAGRLSMDMANKGLLVW